MITEYSGKRRLELHEVLEKFENTKDRKEKISVLRQNDTPALRDYIRCIYDDRVQFNLPDGKPPYKANLPQSYPSTWHKQHMKLKYFVKGLAGDQMMQVKRESMFISILESVHPKDAEVLVDMINKKASAKGFTKKIVQEAFPNLV